MYKSVITVLMIRKYIILILLRIIRVCIVTYEGRFLEVYRSHDLFRLRRGRLRRAVYRR